MCQAIAHFLHYCSYAVCNTATTQRVRGALAVGVGRIRERFDQFSSELLSQLGPEVCIRDASAMASYGSDALTRFRHAPEALVLARGLDDIVVTLRLCNRHGVPFVSRGSGTGLSGGAVPVELGVLIVTARMNRVIEVDAIDRIAIVEPGVSNAAVSLAAGPYGLYYAPDPSSQLVCSIGGNVAENSGGAHCLKYGFTTNHVLGIEMVLADGTVTTFGGDSSFVPGLDLRSVILGSEGTLGVVTKVWLKLLPKPAAVKTLVAGFDSIAAAAGAVAAIIAAGIVPAAMEMMDALAIEACEKAVHAGYAHDAAALIVEVDGTPEEVAETYQMVRQACLDCGSVGLREAADETERQLIWAGRKAAFAAAGRLAPAYIVQDGVVPRTELVNVLERIQEMAQAAGLRVANVFHAGDGNLHPLVLYNPEVPSEVRNAERLSTEIVQLCVALGGSITGEHGVGLEKVCSMSAMFDLSDLAAMGMVRTAFDPAGLANPGKGFPTPRLCGDTPGPYLAHPLELDGTAVRF